MTTAPMTTTDATRLQEPAETQHIDPKLIDPSPFNRRRTWGNLDELAASFQTVGILQDLLARPSPKKAGRFELVFGERRLRGAKIAKLATVPVKVKELTDAEVVDAIAVENLERQDIHPMEEAETFELLRKERGLTADDLAARVHKSRSFVFGRLKLLELHEPARKAFAEDQISASVALYLARIPTEARQLEALKELLPRTKDDDQVGAREAFRIISERFMLRLVDARFDRADATLMPTAGPCTTCPKRTGNQAELFDDVKSPDVCTDPDCFQAKTAAHVERRSEELVKKGVVVIESTMRDNGFRQYSSLPEGFTELARKYYGPNKMTDHTHAQLLKAAGIEAPKVVTFDHEGKEIAIVKSGAIAAAARKIAPKTKPGESKSDRERATALDRALNLAIVVAVDKRGVTDELVRAAVQSIGFYDQATRNAANGMKGKPLAALLAQVLLEGAHNDDAQKALAKAYRVDPKKVKREYDGKKTAAAKPAKKPARKK